MKKITLQETYLHEGDYDPDFRGKVNKELGSFKSLADKDVQDEHEKGKDVNDELKGAKWELSEGNKFGTEEEDAFGDAFKNHEKQEKSKQVNANLQNLDDPFKEAVIGVDEVDPLDELEHVSLVVHPVDGAVGNGVDPLMTPMGGCDSEDASVSTFAAPGGPDFDHNGTGGDAVVLVDGGEIKKEDPSMVVENDPFDEFDPYGFNPDDDNFDEEGDEEWLSYLVEPEQEKHNIHANDMKGSTVGSLGTKPSSPSMPTKPTVPTKESVNVVKMENVKKLQSKLSEVRKSVIGRPEQISENVKNIKNKLLEEIKKSK